MFRTGWSIIRRIECLFTRAASGTIPSVVDVSCVAVGVRVLASPKHVEKNCKCKCKKKKNNKKNKSVSSWKRNKDWLLYCHATEQMG